MIPQARAGLITTVLTLIGGLWLFLAPFIVGYQEVGQDWIDATRNDLWVGGILIGISVLTLFLFVAFELHAARAAECWRAEKDSQNR